MSRQTVVAIIPVLDEEENLAAVLGEVPAFDDLSVLVVDGGSRDRSVDVAASAGAKVITEARRGYGRALMAGVAAAPDAWAYVFLDGDGSDDARQMPRLVEPLRRNQADLVLGSRSQAVNLRSSMPAHQRFGNWLASRMIRRLYGLPISDLAPFRAVRADMLRALDMREMTYGWPTEMIVKAARLGYRIVEVPVSHRPRGAGRSKISGTLRGTLLAGWFIMATVLRYAWGPLGNRGAR